MNASRLNEKPVRETRPRSSSLAMNAGRLHENTVQNTLRESSSLVMNARVVHENWNPIRAVRAEIEREFAALSAEQPHVLQLALNEAEALAWQTDYPHLVFPVLAAEKAQALSRWHERQRALRAVEPVFALAA